MTEPTAAAAAATEEPRRGPPADPLDHFVTRRELAAIGRVGMSGDELQIARELVGLERRRVAALEATADAATMDAHTRALALVGAAGLAAIVAVLLWRMSQD